MIKHVVTFIWTDQVTETDVDEILTRLRGLPDAIEALEDYTFGSDLELTEGTGDFAIIATVADVNALRAYAEHPLHVPLAAQLREMARTRIAVQIEVS